MLRQPDYGHMAIANVNPVGGGTLRDRRLALGLSQEKLARDAECSTAMVKLLERGFTPTHSEVLPRIERVLTAAESAP
jgi:transcriptional regulator with XRE-family HTH domain